MSPCHRLEGGYPKQAWIGRPSKFEHLRVFGCRDFVHVPVDERSKLDSKTRECIFPGYQLDEFDYRLYASGKRIIRSRDVVFKEYHMIEDIEANSQKETRQISWPNEEEFQDARQEWLHEEAMQLAPEERDEVQGEQPISREG